MHTALRTKIFLQLFKWYVMSHDINHKEFHTLKAGKKSKNGSCWSDIYGSAGGKTKLFSFKKKKWITRAHTFLDVFVQNTRSQDGTTSAMTSLQTLLYQRLVHNQQRLEFFSKIKMNRQIFLHTCGVDIIWSVK